MGAGRDGAMIAPWIFRIGLGLLILVGVVACTEEDPTVLCPTCEGGFIAGQITWGGIPPARVELRAIRVDVPDSMGLVGAEAVAAPDGSFAVGVPAGQYLLMAEVDVDHHPRGSANSVRYYYRSAGAPYSSTLRDMLVVRAGERTNADFRLGSVRIELDVPEALVGQTLRLELSTEEDGLSQLGFALSEVGRHETIEFGGLQPLSHHAKLMIRGNDPHQPSPAEQGIYLPAAYRLEEAVSHEVPATGTGAWSIALDPGCARLAGRVRGSWLDREPRRPELELWSPDSSYQVAEIQCNADGLFDHLIFAPEPARMMVRIDEVERWYGGDSFASAEVLELGPGVSLPAIEIVESGLLLEIEDESQDESWGARIDLHDPLDLRVRQTLFLSGRWGTRRYALHNLRPGSYLIRIRPESFLRERWLGQWFDAADDPAGARAVTVPADGGMHQIEITLQAGGRIEGTIEYPQDDRLNAVRVYLTDGSDPESGSSLKCSGVFGDSPAGRERIHYELNGLLPGDYKVGALRLDWGMDPVEPPEETLWYPATTDWNQATVLTIGGSESLTEIDFELR